MRQYQKTIKENVNKFQRFDFGSPEENRKMYGTIQPPLVPLQDMSVPTIIIWGAEDKDKQEAAWILNKDLSGFKPLIENKVLSNFDHDSYFMGTSSELVTDLI